MKLFTHLVLPIALSLTGLAQEKPQQRPNILFIFSDDMGYGDLGCFGSTQVKTPNIDALAMGGMKFTNAYAAAPVCAPSRAGLLTGRYQGRFGFEHNLSTPKHVKPEMVGIPLDELLISDRLKKLGYHTGIVGKWHVGEYLPEHHPNARGFDYFYGMLGGHHDYFPNEKNSHIMENEKRITEFSTPYLTDEFTIKAIDFMDPKLAKPWYLYLSYNSPHSPMQAKDVDMKDYIGVLPKTRQIYCAMQQNMDQNIGKLVKHLKVTKQYENTLIVYFNDNGGSVEVSKAINAPLRGTKGTFLEGGIRVPMIMHWKGKIKPNSVYEQPVIAQDFTPTFVGLAGGTVVEEIIPNKNKKKERKRIRDGVDLMPYIHGKKESSPHKSLYWRMLARGGAIRTGDWKLLMAPHQPTMLFNLKDDISELNNLATKMPEKVKEMTTEYHLWLESFETNPLWISNVMWSKYNRKLYEAEYQLTQPTSESKK